MGSGGWGSLDHKTGVTVTGLPCPFHSHRLAINARPVDHSTVLPSWPQKEKAFFWTGTPSPLIQQIQVIIDSGPGEDAQTEAEHQGLLEPDCVF